MAIIRNIEVVLDASGSAHPTHVDAKVKIIQTFGDDPVVQIDTFGSDKRKFEGKVSQTIQFDRASAMEMIRILGQAYRL